MLVEREYDSLHLRMLEAFPELRPAHDRFLQDWSLGEAPGQYLHLDLLDTLIELSLLEQPSPARDSILERAFQFVEALVSSPDSEIRNLGYVGVLESRAGWWYFRALPFLGGSSCSELDRYHPTWRSSAESSRGVVPPSDEQSIRHADPWHVEEVIQALAPEPAA